MNQSINLSQRIIEQRTKQAISQEVLAGDLIAVVRGKIQRKHRLIRHIWRMCLLMFIAAGSFFLGQMQLFPEFIRATAFPLFFYTASSTIAIFGFLDSKNCSYS